MARFILNLGPRAHVDQELLSTLKYLNVENRVRFLKLCHVHRIFNHNSAPYLTEHFIKISDFHRYNTRGSAFNFIVPKIKSSADRTFYFSSIKEWNKLPDKLKCISELDGFKCAIRKYLASGDFQWGPLCAAFLFYSLLSFLCSFLVLIPPVHFSCLVP